MKERRMRRRWDGGVVWVLAALAAAPAAEARDDNGGWSYLIEKLVADGLSRARVVRVFRDRRMPPFDGLAFSLEPREAQALYRSFRAPQSVARARACRRKHDRDFRTAEQMHAVPASVLSAILYVETQCGSYTGKHVVLHRLARLAMANAPANLRRNIERHSEGIARPEAAVVEARVRMRARELEDLFYPEVRATFLIADELSIDPLGIRGSGSGAFGLPQFLPTSYRRYAVDGNGNGKVSLYEPADAIASAANYLAAHGWRPALSRREQRRVIWNYNRSDAYIDAVLFLAERVESAHPSLLSLAEN
jgi:membrane-bound lytic murein transglycosylase B